MAKNHVVKGDGFNPNGGGFKYILVNGKRYSAEDVGDVVQRVCEPIKRSSNVEVKSRKIRV